MVRLPRTGRDRIWIDDDSRLKGAVRNVIIRPPQPSIPQPLLAKLAAAVGSADNRAGPTRDGLAAARRLFVLPSRAMAGVPIEPLLEPTEPWTVSYAPSRAKTRIAGIGLARSGQLSPPRTRSRGWRNASEKSGSKRLVPHVSKQDPVRLQQKMDPTL